MDWAAFSEGMRAWVAQWSGIQLDDVNWAGDPIGMTGSPRAELSARRHGSGTGTDETRLVPPDNDSAEAHVRVCGNRTLTLSIQVRARELSAGGGAFQYAELLRNALALPSTQATFHAFGVSFVDVAALVDLGRVFDNRQEAGAVLDIRLNSAVDWHSPEVAERIEQVRVTGRVNPNATTPITSPERLIPENP